MGSPNIYRAWGVAQEALMRQVVEAGADGMTVNFPDKLLAYMAGRVARQELSANPKQAMDR
jgi:hypothetical protein